MQPFCSARVILLLFGVLPAIQFDDKPRFKAYEIGNIRPEGELSAELEFAELTLAKTVPNESLRVRHVAAEVSGEFVGHD
jgi:hypothetical protein